MSLVLEHGLRAHRRAAVAFVLTPALQRRTLADYQQRIEALHLYSRPLESVCVNWFERNLMANIVPRLAYLSAHTYALHSVAPMWRRPSACMLALSCTFQHCTLVLKV